MASLTRKIIHGKSYYYLRECQRVGGKPKIVWTMYLGSPQRLLERLTRPKPSRIDLYEFGGSAGAYAIAKALNVVETIDRHVPKRGSAGPSVGQYLLLAALNRSVQPCSKTRLAEWYSKTVLRRLMPLSAGQLTSQRFWDNMNRVEEKHLVAIERELSGTAVHHFGLSLRYLLFDATNFFTFVDSFNDSPTLPQRGHSKDGRDNLRIIGLALLVTSDGDVPLFHQAYPGNQHDSVTFASVAEELAERCRTLGRGVSDITLVFDKGNNSAENLDVVARGPFHFVGSLVPTQHPRLLTVPRSKMRRLDTKQLPAVWSYRSRQIIFGVDRTVLCTFNQRFFEAQHKTLQREIRKRRGKLQQLQANLDRHRRDPRGKTPSADGVHKQVSAILSARHMKDLFAVHVSADRKGIPCLRFQFQHSAWRKLSSTLLGKTILFTDRHDWSDEQIVLAYRAQYHVEGAFRCMKHPRFLTFRPTFHWTDQKLRVHAFYCVLALMIVNLLRRRLDQTGIHLSVAQMMHLLVEIREVAVIYPSPPKTTKPFVRTTLSHLDPQQRALVDALKLKQFRTNPD